MVDGQDTRTFQVHLEYYTTDNILSLFQNFLLLRLINFFIL